ncbi:MAG TPA: amidohydrolase family protein [Candidatus Binatia bacterium]|nr:amidohydrolase family protein [Candidatus Binatia bacterium]
MRKTTRRGLLTGAAALGALQTVAQPGFAASSSPMPKLPGRGDFVVRGAYVLTMDPKLGDLPNADIHVRNGEIVAVGTNLSAPGAGTIDARTMIALPGLIETHWHMWGTAARNLAGDEAKTGYFPFSRVLGVLFTPEDNARGVRLALAEALNTGLTTVHNWSHNLLTPAYADAEIAVHREVGGRARFSYGYSRNTGPNETLPLDDVVRVQRLYFGGQTDGLLTLGIASRGPENNTIDICRKEWAFARGLKIPITSHIGTDPKKTFGIKALDDAGLLGPDVQLVHATNLAPGDLERIKRTGTHVSVSPYTEMRTGFGFGPITEFLATGCPISLSIDTPILCGHSDMFATMRGIQNQENGRKQSEFALPARQALEMATIGGARDLGIADKVGSLTPGKRADLILVRTDALNMAPFTEPVHMIVQSAHPVNVDTVVVDGRILKRHGQLTAIDVSRVMREAQETIDRVQAHIGESHPAGCAQCGT